MLSVSLSTGSVSDVAVQTISAEIVLVIDGRGVRKKSADRHMILWDYGDAYSRGCPGRGTTITSLHLRGEGYEE